MDYAAPRFAILQKTLDQTIDRETFEAAAVASRSIPRPDCAQLLKDLFGIVVSDLAYEHAVALQTELARRDFPTEVVEQTRLAQLGNPAPLSALRIDTQGLQRVDLYGNATAFPWSHFVFAAAGYIIRMRQRVAGQHEEVVARGRHGTVTQTVTDYRLQDVPEFRLEFFFDMEPYRLQCVLDPEHTVHINDTPVALRNQAKLDDFLKQLVALLPVERVNLGIRKLTAGQYYVYPRVRAFEEEIIWSFYRLLGGAA